MLTRNQRVISFHKMASITTDLIEELMTYNNKINCVTETCSSVQQSDVLIINHVEKNNN